MSSNILLFCSFQQMVLLFTFFYSFNLCTGQDLASVPVCVVKNQKCVGNPVVKDYLVQKAYKETQENGDAVCFVQPSEEDCAQVNGCNYEDFSEYYPNLKHTTVCSRAGLSSVSSFPQSSCFSLDTIFYKYGVCQDMSVCEDECEMDEVYGCIPKFDILPLTKKMGLMDLNLAIDTAAALRDTTTMDAYYFADLKPNASEYCKTQIEPFHCLRELDTELCTIGDLGYLYWGNKSEVEAYQTLLECSDKTLATCENALYHKEDTSVSQERAMKLQAAKTDSDIAPEQRSSSGSPTVVIIVMAIVSVIVVSAIVLFIVYYRRRSRSPAPISQGNGSYHEMTKTATKISTLPSEARLF